MMHILTATVLAVAIGAAGGACASDAPSPPPAEAEGSAATEGDTAIVLDQANTRGEAHVGDRIEIRLNAQFGTGFSWGLREGSALLHTQGETMESAHSDIEGGWEVQVFAFEAAAPGEARVEFGYRRPWEATKPPKETAVFEITITAE
jgi:predicted secreted protein